MSLIKCPECGAEIPENSKFCLECGEKIEIDESDEEEIEEDYTESEREYDINMENIEDYNETKYDLDFKTKIRILASNKITLLIISIFLIICIVSGVFFINSSINYSKGIQAIKDGNYEEAVNYLEKSNKSEAESMIELVGYYEDGMSDYKSENYIDAYEKLMLIDATFPIYDHTQKTLNQLKDMIIKENLQQAKDNYANGEYIDAYDCLKTVLEYDKSQVDALQMQYDYSKNADEMEARLAEEKRKADEEAAKQAEIEKIQSIKDNMNVWEGYGVKVAVAKAYKKRSTGLHVANGNGTFVYLDVWTYNDSGSITHVNPNDFTLSTSTGYTVSHDSDTYSLSNYFDAVDLNSGQQTGGYLIFFTNDDSRYTLNYNGIDGSATKELIL